MNLFCVVCGCELKNYGDEGENQPYAGLAFFSHGHYGSTNFDPMDGHFLELNVCAECLREAGEKGRVLLGRDSKLAVSGVAEGLPPCVVGRVPVKQPLVPWHEGLENGRREDCLVLEPEEIGSPLHPEVEYTPGILDAYGPKL